MPRVGKTQMRKHKQPKGASKKAASAVKDKMRKPVSKRYGKAVMKSDPDKPGRKIGYASTAKTKTGKYKPRKRTTKVGRRSLKK